MTQQSTPLTPDQVKRYSRHIIMNDVGSSGQRKLMGSKALIIGAGGLGSPAAVYLSLAGVGTVGMVDFDVVELSNLQRQILHHTPDVGRPKLESGKDNLLAYNPDINVVLHEVRLESENAMDIISQYDLVINGADNFATRYLVNDACYLLNKPLVDGSILIFDGQATVFVPGEGCYRCLFPSPPPPGMVPNCAEAGVLGALTGLVGSIQATEALKYFLGIGESLIIGAGGLGSPAAVYLSLAGVGTVGMVDFDVVELSNLQRQILHHTPDVGRPKLESGKDNLLAYNPDINVVLHEVRLESENAMDIISQYDLVINGADNFATRYLVNDACYLLNKPLVDGSILIFDGQATVFVPGEGCYRCLFPSPPPPGMVPNCAEAGVLGALTGLVGSIQATEALKYFLGIGESLISRLLLVDALSMTFREVKLKRNPQCPLCGDNPTVTELIDYEIFCGLGSPEEMGVH